MASTTLSPATPSQVKRKGKKSHQIMFILELSFFLLDFFDWIMCLFVMCISYALARVACSLLHMQRLWNQQGQLWWQKRKESELHVRLQVFLLMIKCLTWVRGSLWICFFWVLFHSPLLACWFLIPISLSLLGKKCHLLLLLFLIDKFFNGKLDPFKAPLPKILVPLIILRSKE